MNPRPRLIVTLPARTVAEARPQMVEAARAGADMVELRLDRWAGDQLGHLARLFPTPVPALATVRSRLEGGEGPDGGEERTAALARAASHPFALVDVELERDRLPPTPLGERPSRWVGSRHFPEGTPMRVLDSAVVQPADGFAFRKFVVPSSIRGFLDELLPRMADWVTPRTAVFTTGASGPLGRIWARELGQPVVFAALPDHELVGGRTPVEPSQIPVDELHRSWSAGRGRRFAVIGHPIAHSLSPAIHAGWLASENRAASFVGLDVADEYELGRLAQPGESRGWDGWSITSPWKPAAARLAAVRSEAVEATGVANTLTFDAAGSRAELTDSDGVRRRALELIASGAWNGDEALVLGTGGAARAAVFALAPGRRVVWVVGRRPEAVRALTDSLGGKSARESDRHPVGLVVHATTFGRGGSGPLTPDLEGWVGPGSTVLDFVYNAADPGVQRAVEKSGGVYEDGRRLLVYQAAEAYRLWWGEAPTEEAQQAALRRVGCAA